MDVKDAADHAARERPGHPADLIGCLVKAKRTSAEFAWRMFDNKAVESREYGTEERAVSKADGRECPNVAEQDLGERSDSAGEQTDQQHLLKPDFISQASPAGRKQDAGDPNDGEHKPGNHRGMRGRTADLSDIQRQYGLNCHDGELCQHRKHKHGHQRFVMSGDLKRVHDGDALFAGYEFFLFDPEYDEQRGCKAQHPCQSECHSVAEQGGQGASDHRAHDAAGCGCRGHHGECVADFFLRGVGAYNRDCTRNKAGEKALQQAENQHLILIRDECHQNIDDKEHQPRADNHRFASILIADGSPEGRGQGARKKSGTKQQSRPHFRMLGNAELNQKKREKWYDHREA